MFSPFLFALAILSQSDPAVVGSSALRSDEPPVRIWLNGDRRFEPGAAARVQVEARDDGYLLVLNFDTDGRVRVLFPLSPSDDGFVRGGRRYEVRDDRDRSSFNAGEPGSGFVYVALAPDPWRLRDWTRGNAWDYDQVRVDGNSGDPERDLTRMVEGLASNRGFDYDIIEYFVDDIEVVRYEYQPSYFSGPGIYSFDPTCDPYWSSGWYCGGRSGVVVSYGRSYRNDWWSIGYGPSWYWPSRYDYYYRPYSYGRGSSYTSYYRPWIVTGPTYRPGGNRPVLAGRSRDYEVGRATPWSFDNDRQSGRPVSAAGDAYRPRPEAENRARPAAGRPSSVPEARGRPAVDRSAERGGTERSRPATGTTRPDDRPATERPSTSRAPTTSRPPAATPPTRARTRPPKDDADSRASTADSRSTVPSATRARAPSGATRSDPVRSSSVEPTRRVVSSPPAARSAPARDPAPARAAPRSAPPSKPAARAAPTRTRRPPGN